MRLTSRDAKLDEPMPMPTLAQLRGRVRHIRNHLTRNLEALSEERGAKAAIRRSKVHEGQAALELAIAELQAHPDWRG